MTADRESYEEKKKELYAKYRLRCGTFCIDNNERCLVSEFGAELEQLVKAQAVKEYKERLEKGVKNRPDKTCRFDEDGCNFGGSCYECAYAEILKLIQEE